MNEILKAYRSSRATSADYSSPYELVRMLFDGAMERTARAMGHIERGEIAAKGECLGPVVGIVGHLRDSLVDDVGDGSISRNLDALYDYILRRVTEANLYNDKSALEEVQKLLGELRAGWCAIPPEHRDPARGGASGVKPS